MDLKDHLILPGSNYILGSVCVYREKNKNIVVSSKRENAFITDGFSNWKIASERFKKHEDSQCHRDSVLISDIRNTNEILQMSFAQRMIHE